MYPSLQRYKQLRGQYDEIETSPSVVNEAPIFLILILLCMTRMYVKLNDVKGAFLTGTFSKGEKVYATRI